MITFAEHIKLMNYLNSGRTTEQFIRGLNDIEKINFIRLENPHTTKEQICELLDIKASMYYRHLRKLKQRGTLFSA